MKGRCLLCLPDHRHRRNGERTQWESSGENAGAMLLHALLDSNIAYRASAGRLAGRSTIECWGCAGTVIELVSDIVDEATFAQTQSRLTRLRALVDDRVLPDPDTLFAWYAGTPLPQDVVTYWPTVARRVADAATFADIEEDARTMRAAREEQRDLFDAGVRDMIRRVNPSADFAQWRVTLPPKQAAEFRERLWSAAALHDFATSFVLRRVADPSEELIRRAQKILEPAYRTYRGILWDVISNGRKLETNDGIDMMMALPLWQPDWVVVTEDARLRRFAELGEMPPGRLRALSEVL